MQKKVADLTLSDRLVIFGSAWPVVALQRENLNAAADDRVAVTIDAGISGAREHSYHLSDTVEVAEPLEPEWQGTIRAMAQAEYGRSWKKTSDVEWTKVASIAGEAVKNAYSLTAVQQTQATFLYLDTIKALKGGQQ